MKIRLLQDSELEHIKKLWDYCFEKSYDDFFKWYFANYCQAENVLGSFIGDELAGMIHLNPYSVYLHEQRLATSYFVGVATAPQHRNKGVMKAMLKEAFNVLQNKGQSIALLMPIMAGIYLPYGFSYCYRKLKYQLPLQELGRILPKAEGYEIAFANEKDAASFSEIYCNYTKKVNGYLLRGEKEWSNILGELFSTQREAYAAIVKKGDICCGYMLYFIKDNIFRIVELISLDNDAKTALLNFAAGHFSQCDELFWLAPEDDLTYLNLKLNKYYPCVQPFMMGRVLDPLKAVADLKLSVSEPVDLKIELSDPLIEANNDVFALANVNGQACLEQMQSSQAHIKLDIGTFAQLCFGSYCVRSLYAAGKIKTNDEKQLKTLAGIFREKTNYINEYF